MTPEAVAALMDRAYTDMRPWSAQDIATTLAAPHTRLVTRSAGFVIAQCVADTCEILALATDPEAQRGGVASALLSELFGICTQTGITCALLDVARQNHPARAFYAVQGFAQIGERRGYYTLRDGSKDDALLLSRAVA